MRTRAGDQCGRDRAESWKKTVAKSKCVGMGDDRAFAERVRVVLRANKVTEVRWDRDGQYRWEVGTAEAHEGI